jgi:hypothetical protein
MDQTVTFSTGTAPAWPTVSDLLARSGFSVQVRMVDGELTFPDEVPSETWRELRLGTPQGMVTVRREPGRVVLVVWGNADATLREAWNALTWAFAAAGAGQVLSAAGPQDADAYRRTVDLPAGLRPAVQ